MIVFNSPTVQINSPVDSSQTRRVNDVSRTSNVSAEDKEKEAAEKLKVKQDEVILRQLRDRDREVRAHEGAHVAAGAELVRGGPSFTLQRGPDGRSYAIGGEVQLDVSAVADDPEATLIKAARIRGAALAPAEPSSQDRRVASNANQLASRARVDIAVLRREETQLVDKQQSLDEASNGTPDAANNNDSSVSNPPSASVIEASDTQSLQSNEVPAAAISAFMATAQTESVPVLLNQFA